MNSGIISKFTEVEHTRIHYLSAGQGETILFIHGFPTSAYLWRNVMAPLAKKYHVIAIDLPGYGQSDKKFEDSFSFRYYERILSGFLKNLEIEKVTLGVHDLGGPVGLYWMMQHMEKVQRLVLFNTLVYPKFSWGVKLFGLMSVLPVLKDWLTSASGIKKAMQIGIYNHDHLTTEVLQNYQAPFVTKDARKVLLKSVQRLSMKGFKEIESKLPSYQGPIQIIYGENDRILPKVADTMTKVKSQLPQANVVSIPKCGHFLQEDEPEKISDLLLKFMED